MIYLIAVLVVMFICVAFIPIIQWFGFGSETIDETVYEFPDKLFESELSGLKCENINHTDKMSRLSLQQRGSVRLAQGRILSNEDLEEKKAAVYSVDLP